MDQRRAAAAKSGAAAGGRSAPGALAAPPPRAAGAPHRPPTSRRLARHAGWSSCRLRGRRASKSLLQRNPDGQAPRVAAICRPVHTLRAARPPADRSWEQRGEAKGPGAAKARPRPHAGRAVDPGVSASVLCPVRTGGPASASAVARTKRSGFGATGDVSAPGAGPGVPVRRVRSPTGAGAAPHDGPLRTLSGPPQGLHPEPGTAQEMAMPRIEPPATSLVILTPKMDGTAS